MTGIILAGGKSTRLGTDKAFLKIGERTMIKEILGKLKNIFREILIIANEKERFNYLGIEVFSDIIPFKGPLGGIYTGLVRSKSFYNFIVACDMPFLNLELIKFMLENVENFDVVVPKHNGRLEPLCAVYSKMCVKPIEKELLNNNLKIIDFFRYVKVKIIGEEQIAKFGSEQLGAFTNINTWNDYVNLTHKVEP